MGGWSLLLNFISLVVHEPQAVLHMLCPAAEKASREHSRLLAEDPRQQPVC